MTRHKVLLAAVLVTALTAAAAFGAQFNFGGDLGFYLFDVSSGSGIQPGRDSLGNPAPQPYPDTTGRINTLLESHGLGLYWNVQLTDKVNINILTEVGGTSTGATPSLGKKLGTQQGDGGTLKALAVPEANIQVMLPWEVQATTGIIRPLFTEDYGGKKGYQEANRLFKSSANPYGGEWHDLGVEFYKSLEPGGGVSIPAYLYLLAGEEQYGDNNNSKSLLLHVEPGYKKFTLLGSFGFGREDALDSFNVMRYAAGLAGDFGKFWFRGEFTGGSWAGNVVYNEANKDTAGNILPEEVTLKPIAYYVKAGYNFIPDRLGLVLTYDQYSPDWTTRSKLGWSPPAQLGNTTDAGESYNTIGATVQFWVIPGSALLLEYNRALWKVGDGTLCKLNFNRVTLGWRTIF